MLKILVTGVNGFVGKHLVRELKARELEVLGLGTEDVPSPEIADQLDDYFSCDLTDKIQVDALPLENVDTIINLAGLANVGASFGAEELYKKVNVEVLTTLGERLLDSKEKARLIAVSTGAVYDPKQQTPLTEESKLITEGSPYALSKIMMEEAAQELQKQGLDCIIVRPFNHVGPGQAPGFLLPDLYQKLLDAKETGKPVTVGNLTTKRDYTDVRDVVRAYSDLATAETLQDNLFNVCSGTSRTGQSVLDALVSEMGLKDKVTIDVDQSLIRPNDPADLYGSFERLSDETGWEPEIPFEQTIKDIVNQ
ncbi:MAG: NAD(P)-dependent oxidoreductase [Candidatus Saccharibacteria bacterium]|nr:NAD(P)-dependent oxidoreductase [Candidatus Saccharibacteria bacterium]